MWPSMIVGNTILKTGEFSFYNTVYFLYISFLITCNVFDWYDKFIA
jgi:hypothetical protein